MNLGDNFHFGMEMVIPRPSLFYHEKPNRAKVRKGDKRLNYKTKKIRLQKKINELTADIIKLRAELNYLERQKGLEMQEKIMGGARYDTSREV